MHQSFMIPSLPCAFTQKWVICCRTEELTGHGFPSLKMGSQVSQIALAKSLFMTVLPPPLLGSPFHFGLSKISRRTLILGRYVFFFKTMQTEISFFHISPFLSAPSICSLPHPVRIK